MQQFMSDGVPIAYLDEGPVDGRPIVLVHGFGSNARVNWVQTGWVDLLVKDGRRVIALDNRGHGQSGLMYDPADYDLESRMSEDVIRLMDHAGVGVVDLMGYSMGAWISTYLAIRHPERLRSLLLGGLASSMLSGLPGQQKIADALEAASDEAVADPRLLIYRTFARQTRSDMRALAACMRGTRKVVVPEDLRRLTMPVLISTGERDDVAGSPEDLAALLPNPRILHIPGRDHMSAVGDKVHKAGVLDFLHGLDAAG